MLWQILTKARSLDPRVPRALLAVYTLGVASLAWSLRRFGVVYDVDSINFGLAARHFDVLAQQPQPPGYPFYVGYLRLIAALLPAAGPLEIAKAGSSVAGTLCVPVAMLAARAFGAGPFGIALAATFAAFHPVLILEGVNGQNHAAAATLAFAIIGLSARQAKSPSPWGAAQLGTVSGFAFGCRPEVPVLFAPFLLRALWRARRDQQLAAALPALLLALSAIALSAHGAGSLELLLRAQRALTGELFLANYSVFGARSTPGGVGFNVALCALGLALALIPWMAGWFAPPGWRGVFGATVGLHAAFFGLGYIAEIGYLAPVAALACLGAIMVDLARSHVVRLLALHGPVALWVVLPASVGVLDVPVPLPSVWHAMAAPVGEAAVLPHRADTLYLTDNPTVTGIRLVPYEVGATVALGVRRHPLNPAFEGWLLFTPDGLRSMPTEVPWEVGPPSEFDVPGTFAEVVVLRGAGAGFRAFIAQQTRCPERRPGAWPAACFPTLTTGQQTLRVTAAP